MRFAWLLFLVDASRIGLARTAHCEFIALHLLLHIFASVLPQPSVIRSHSVALAALLVADSCPWTSLSCRFPSSSSSFWSSCRWHPRLALLLLLTFQMFPRKASVSMFRPSSGRVCKSCGHYLSLALMRHA